MPTSSRERTKRVAFVDAFSMERRHLLPVLRRHAAKATAPGGRSAAAVHVRTESVA